MTEKMHGYASRVLDLDLSGNRVRITHLDSEFAQKYIGATGFCATFVYDEVPPETHAFDPRNVLVFAVGPLTGTGWPASARYTVASKSPLVCNPDTLQGAWGDADAGGAFGPTMKLAGYDSILVRGRSERPTYIYLNEDNIEFKDASHLWGKGTYETCETIERDLRDPALAISCIGPAGEKLVRYANIRSTCLAKTCDHFAGRCGFGAIMGSKNLKALAVSGHKESELAEPEKFEELVRKVLPRILAHPHTQNVRSLGTAGALTGYELIGDLPIQNWRGGSWSEGAERIGGESLSNYGRKRRTCTWAGGGCPIGCKGEITFDKALGPVKPFQAGSPEYENLGMLGSMNMVDDLDAIIACNYLCNDYGLDAISTGASASFAFECYERGVLSKRDTGGLELKWGGSNALVELIVKIANRDGIGDALAEGVLRASRKIGRGSSEWAIEVKGVELPAHDPRAFEAAFGLAYAISIKGANHNEAAAWLYEGEGWFSGGDRVLGLNELFPRHGGQGKGRMVALTQNYMTFIESLGLCIMGIFNLQFSDLCDAYRLATGLNTSDEQLLTASDRIVNLRRAFNNRCGLERKHDYLPKRLLTLERPSGGSAGYLPNLEPMLREYYEFREWDYDTGKPRKEKLCKLGLEQAAAELYG